MYAEIKTKYHFVVSLYLFSSKKVYLLGILTLATAQKVPAASIQYCSHEAECDTDVKWGDRWPARQLRKEGETLDVRPEYLSSVTRTHMVDRENGFT